ncbi:MAG TPA: hypothetical protein VJG30_00930 [Candidatus Nanoarchaeia archaeon]|nr:hypothetical protein [Candidatus Nanoarchaeia archaeon]
MGVLKRCRRHATWGRSLGKKGQLQIQETILVVFVFVIIIILGMFFFINYQKSSIKNDFTEFQRTKARSNIITLGEMPELACSKGGIKEACVDSLKLVAFKNQAEKKKTEYAERFGHLNITLYIMYPKRQTKRECNKDNIEECEIWNIYARKPLKVTSKIVEKTPISLYNPKKDTYYIALMIVEAYNV